MTEEDLELQVAEAMASLRKTKGPHDGEHYTLDGNVRIWRWPTATQYWVLWFPSPPLKAHIEVRGRSLEDVIRSYITRTNMTVFTF